MVVSSSARGPDAPLPLSVCLRANRSRVVGRVGVVPVVEPLCQLRQIFVCETTLVSLGVPLGVDPPSRVGLKLRLLA